MTAQVLFLTFRYSLASLPPLMSTMRAPTVSSYFVKAALAKLTDQPQLKAQLLAENQIDAERLHSARARIKGEAFANLLRDAMQAMEDEQLGYGNAPQPLGSWATATQLCLSAETLGEALRRLARFYRLIPWGIETRIEHRQRSKKEDKGKQEEKGDGETLFIMSSTADWDFAPYIFESFLFYVYRYSNWLIKQPINLKAVSFRFPKPPQSSEYPRLFRSEAFLFEQEHNALVFPSAVLNQRIDRSSEQLESFLNHTNLAMLAQNFPLSNWQQRVEKALSLRLSENPGITDIAAALEVHPHTLRSHLKKEGLQFKEVKEQLRRELAVKLLRSDRLSVEDVALQLGFSETSAFSRAFKQWYQQSPLAYRQASSEKQNIFCTLNAEKTDKSSFDHQLFERI